MAFPPVGNCPTKRWVGEREETHFRKWRNPWEARQDPSEEWTLRFLGLWRKRNTTSPYFWPEIGRLCILPPFWMAETFIWWGGVANEAAQRGNDNCPPPPGEGTFPKVLQIPSNLIHWPLLCLFFQTKIAQTRAHHSEKKTLEGGLLGLLFLKRRITCHLITAREIVTRLASKCAK